MTEITPKTEASAADSSVDDGVTPAGMRHSYVGVAVGGATLVAGAAFSFGAVTAFHVALGAGFAALNLWTIERSVRALLGQALQIPWLIFLIVKYLALVGVAFLILQRGSVPLLPVIVGFGALPMGIVIGQLVQPLPEVPGQKAKT